MPDAEIGAISIGISADVSQLKSALKQAEAEVKNFTIPEKTVAIRVRIRVPGEQEVSAAQKKIAALLLKAQTLEIPISPTITVKGDKIKAFRNTVQTQMDAQKPIGIDIEANVDATAIQNQIKSAIGVIDVPLRWFWDNGPPPAGSGPGGSGPSGPPPGPRAGGGPAGRSTAKPTATATAGRDPHVCDVCGVSIANPALMPDHIAYAHKNQQPAPAKAPIKSAPAQPTAGAPAGAAAAAGPAVAPTINPPTFTKTAAPTNEKDLRGARFGHIVEQLVRGRVGGITQLLKAGGIFDLQSDDIGLSAKRNSDLAKYLKEAPEGTSDAIVVALKEYTKAINNAPSGRAAFSGGAKSLAGDTPDVMTMPGGRQYLRSNANFMSTFNEALRRQVETEAKARAAEFAKRSDVRELKMAFKDQGFAALGPGLEEARQMISMDPVKAREMTVELLSKFWSQFPKEAKRLFSQDPGKGTTSGAGPRRKKPKGVAGKTDLVEPGIEATGAGLSALFGELFRVSLPLRDEARSEIRREQIAERAESKEEGLIGPVFGAQPEKELTGEAAAAAKARAVAAAAEFEQAQKARKSSVKTKKINPYSIDIIEPRTKQERAFAAQASSFRSFTDEEIRLTEEREAREAQAAAGATGVRSARPNLTPEQIAKAEDAKRRLALKAAGRGKAGGGPVIKPGGLMDRLAKKGYQVPAGAVRVGEEGEEIFVPDQAGHVIDNKAQNIPMWMQRAREGKLRGKDLTGMVAGGRVQAVPGAIRTGFRSPFAGEMAAIGAAQLSPSGGVQRVFVVNWPGGFGQGGTQSAPAQGQLSETFNAAQLAALLSTQVKTKKAGKPSGGADDGGGPAARLSAEEEARLDIERQTRTTERRLRSRGFAADLAAEARSLPTRGAQTATGEVFALTLGGLDKVIKKRRLADEAATRSNVAETALSKAEEKLFKIETQLAAEQNPTRVSALTKKYEDQSKAVEIYADNFQKLSATAEELSKTAVSGGDKLRVFGANLGGIIAGTFLFSGALGAAQGALTAVVEGIGPIIERMTGFQNVTAQTTSALADQTRQSGGAVRSVVALREAQLGLSTATAETISPLVEQRVRGEAANKNLVETIELLHTFEGLQKQNRGLPPGIDKSLIATTGGVFGTQIGGVPSTFEQIGAEFKGMPRAAERARGEFLEPRSGAGLSALMGTLDDEFRAELERSTERLAVFNEQAARGGETMMRLVPATQAQADASAKLAKDAGLEVFARQLSHFGIAIEGATTPEDVLRFGQAVQTSASRPNPELMVRQLLDRIIPNQLAAFEAEERLQLETQIPAQRALEFMAQPPTPFGAGVVQIGQGTNGAQPIGRGANLGGFGQNALGVDPTAQSSFQQYQGIAQRAIDAVIQKAQEGRRALAQMGVPAQLLSEMESLGNQAQGIQLGIANRNAAFEAAQYNRQMFILNRQLADAKALLGQQVGSQGRLGQLQRQNFELSKEQNALQLQASGLALELQQRQINFQRAIAGFVAPGTTPEERAARIQAAKIEADFAQKQLDIQRKLLGLGQRQFGVGVAIFDESARRQVQEIQMAMAELSQSRQITLDNRLANQALDAIRARQAQINQEIGVAIEKATKRAALAINTALEIANASGEAFATILNQTASAWQTFVIQGARAVRQLTAGGRATQGTGPPSQGGAAGGAFFETSGATSLTVGEAGTETVAVLRNPRRIQGSDIAMAGAGAGGAMVQMNVVITGNSVREDMDLVTLAEKLGDAVERRFMQKTSLFGLRRPL